MIHADALAWKITGAVYCIIVMLPRLYWVDKGNLKG